MQCSLPFPVSLGRHSSVGKVNTKSLLDITRNIYKCYVIGVILADMV